jgi:hypothetical protein
MHIQTIEFAGADKEQVRSGDYCNLISVRERISLKDFYFLNPEINANCTNLLRGVSYCVAPVGDISTYPAYPRTSNFITLTPMSFSTSSFTPSSLIPIQLTALSTDLPRISGA